MTSALLVGLGEVGLGYDLDLPAEGYVLTHARALSAHPAFELLAGVDPDEERRALFTSHYRRPVFADMAHAFEEVSPELVVIAGPTRLHAKLLQQLVARGGIRAILCEKPLSYDLDEARGMVQACENAGIRLYVNYMRRSDPGVIRVKAWIDAGRIAAPFKGVAWYSKGFLNNGTHIFNLLAYWLGPMQRFDIIDAGRTWSHGDPEPDVRVRFAQGSVNFLAAREESFSHYTVELIASNGRLRYEQGGESIEWQGVQDDPHFPGYRTLAPVPEQIPTQMTRYQWNVTNELAAALEGRPHHLCPATDALATLAACRKIVESR